MEVFIKNQNKDNDRLCDKKKKILVLLRKLKLIR